MIIPPTRRPPLSQRAAIKPVQGQPVSLAEWLDLFSTELARLRPHFGYTAANTVARILSSTSRLDPPVDLAQLAAEELAFMSAVDGA
jgi:hypothetical protein